jgi:hypothetical protein
MIKKGSSKRLIRNLREMEENKQLNIHVVVESLKDLQKPSFKDYVNMFYDVYFIDYYQNKKNKKPLL